MTFFRIGLFMLAVGIFWPLKWCPVKIFDTELTVCIGFAGALCLVISVGLAMWIHLP